MHVDMAHIRIWWKDEKIMRERRKVIVAITHYIRDRETFCNREQLNSNYGESLMPYDDID